MGQKPEKNKLGVLFHRPTSCTPRDNHGNQRRRCSLKVGWPIFISHHYCLPSGIKKVRETHWWNRKLEKLRKETTERFRQAKKGNSEELWNLSNATRDAYRKEISQAKGKSWTSFCSDIEKGAEAARLNRLLSRNPGAMLNTLRLPDGAYLESEENPDPSDGGALPGL